MKIMLIRNQSKDNTKYAAQQIIEKLNNWGVEVINEEQDVSGGPNIIIVLGGDGTILRVARQYGMRGIPVLGINMGTVGFLCNIEGKELDLYIERLIQQDFFIDERMMLESSISGNEGLMHRGTCLNEITVRSHSLRMIKIALEVNGSSLGSYRGDGLIVATPTGTTAYSLSAGGPISDPGIEALFVTPIASHTLSKRPLVLGSSKIIRLSLQDDNGIVCFDGQVKVDIKRGTSIEIKKSKNTLRLIDLKKRPYFETFETRLRRIEGFCDV